MKQLTIALFFTTSLFFSFSVLAEKETKPTMYSYATYFHCDVVQEEAVDDFIKTSYAPVYNSAVKKGIIKGWGWLAHHTGGEWRRILYHMAPTINELFDAQKVMSKQLDDKLGKGPDALGQGCKYHDDYIWEYVAGSAFTSKGKSRGKVSMSTYLVCDFNKQDRADEIVQNSFSRVYNSFVEQGKLTSWGWLSHTIGGKYRKLLTLTAQNVDDLLNVNEDILEELFFKRNKALGKEFNKICESHQDYIWKIQLETP